MVDFPDPAGPSMAICMFVCIANIIHHTINICHIHY
jgi:hypothetical protein